MLRSLFGMMAASVLFAACGDPCKLAKPQPPDYTQDEAWLCRPGSSREGCGVDVSTTEVRADGTTAPVAFSPAVSPRAACFYVYPTVDLRLLPGLHTDLKDTADALTTTATQAARLQQVCSLHAPVYRQVTLGTYAASVKPAESAECFAVAYGDVLRAFDQFLADIGPTRPVVLVGHSQGGQHVSHLLKDRFDDSGALAGRLVAALPIGWAVGTALGQQTGGSWQHLPLCERRNQVGCVVAYRTFTAGNDMAAAGGFTEGPSVACVDPAGPEDGGAAVPLAAADFPTGSSWLKLQGAPAVSTPFIEYRNFYSARCVRDGGNAGLEIAVAPGAGDVRQNPIDFSAAGLSGELGTHILDMQFTQGDLVKLVGEKVAAFP